MALFSRTIDIGIDLGTANILVYKSGEGIVLNEPSIVAVDKRTNSVLAVGHKAYKMIGKSSENIVLIKPLKDGVIANFNVTEQMLNIFLAQLNLKSMFRRPVILICCPVGITEVEKSAIKEVAEKCGGKKVYLEEEPKVAAVGSGLNIFIPQGNMVIDIGGGTTDIAVISLGEITNSDSLKIAGNTITQDIIDYIKLNYQLLVGFRTAEEIKQQIGSVKKSAKLSMEVKGRDIVSGLPKIINVTSDDIADALASSVGEIVKATKEVLEKTSPELISDIIDQGIILTGGGALLRGLDELLSEKLKVSVYVADDPLNAVVKGTGLLLEFARDAESGVVLAD